MSSKPPSMYVMDKGSNSGRTSGVGLIRCETLFRLYFP